MKKESQPNKSFRVCKGTACVTVFPWIHPTTGKRRWRFAVEDSTAKGGWRYKTSKTKDEAKVAAEKALEQMSAGGLVWDMLPTKRRKFLEELHAEISEHDEEAVLAFVRSRHKSSDVGTAVARFMEHKEVEAGEKTPHLKRARKVLEDMAKAFPGKTVVEIHLPELKAWYDERTGNVGWKRKQDIRTVLVMFWKWCQIEQMVGPDPFTVAKRLPSPGSQHGERRVLTHEEMKKLLETVAPEWRAWAVLGGFGGLRPEEIAPAENDKKAQKRGLHCEEIDWKFGVIRLPGIVSKVGLPRLIPLNDALRAGLEWAGIKEGMNGPVCLSNPSDAGETRRLGKEVFGDGWPQDALRHSYGSFRNAVVRSLAQVAEEMGTSVVMMGRHYHNPKAEEEGAEWFALRPPGRQKAKRRLA
jgi:integrase